MGLIGQDEDKAQTLLKWVNYLRTQVTVVVVLSGRLVHESDGKSAAKRLANRSTADELGCWRQPMRESRKIVLVVILASALDVPAAPSISSES